MYRVFGAETVTLGLSVGQGATEPKAKAEVIEPRNYYRVKEVDAAVVAANNTVLTAMVREAKLFRGLRTWRGRLIIGS